MIRSNSRIFIITVMTLGIHYQRINFQKAEQLPTAQIRNRIMVLKEWGVLQFGAHVFEILSSLF
jgi:hypothetical protein